MKFKITFLTLNLFLFVYSFALDVRIDSSIQLEYPNELRILELAQSYENKSVKVKHLRNTAISLGVLSFLALIGYHFFGDKFFSQNSNSNSENSEISKNKNSQEYTQNDYWGEKSRISFWGKEAIRRGIYFGGITSLVGIISTSTDLTSQLIKKIVGDLIESGSMQNTFLTLKEALTFYLNWVAELLNDLNNSEIKNAGFFANYSGLIDGVFVWTHGLESFLALVLSRARIEFGENSLKYKSILLEQKHVLDKTTIFINSLQKEMNMCDESGVCNISDETFRFLRILITQVSKFSQNMQLILYKDSVGIVKISTI